MPNRLVLLLLIFSLWTTSISTQALLAQDLVGDDPTIEELVERLKEYYEVTRLQEAWLFRPLEESDKFQSLEVRQHQVIVDGEQIDGISLYRLLGSGAAQTFFYLASDGQRYIDSVPSATATSDDRLLSIKSAASRNRRLEGFRQNLSEALLRVFRSESERETLELLKESRRIEDLRQQIIQDRCEGTQSGKVSEVSTNSSQEGDPQEIILCDDFVVRREHETTGVVVVDGRLHLSGKVTGNTAVIFGHAIIEGRLDGSLLVIDGDVDVRSGGLISGDVKVVNGMIRLHAGGQVLGEKLRTSFSKEMLDF